MRWIIVADDQHKAFYNLEMITAFRSKTAANGSLGEGEIEVEFIGGAKHKLLGESAHHFWQAISSTFAD